MWRRTARADRRSGWRWDGLDDSAVRAVLAGRSI